MKTGLYALLEIHEELRNKYERRARLTNSEDDWFAFLFFCDKCKEVMQQIEDEKKEG